MKIAVIGGGISGNLAARILSSKHEVVLFEANDYLGGHTKTIDVDTPWGVRTIDTGFMVFNRPNYPNFCDMLQRLGVASRESDMSFSVQCQQSRLEYSGESLNTLFAQRSNLWRPKFYQLLRDILRFNRESSSLLQGENCQLTMGDYLRQHSYSQTFVRQYLVPMAAAIWSATPRAVETFPARFIIAFFANHQLLQTRGHPMWRTIEGGARSYVKELIAPLIDRVRLNCPIEKVIRHEDRVEVLARDGQSETFDQVVLATHADQSLRILSDADKTEQDILGSFTFQANDVVIHHDTSLLPATRRAWASWNYHVAADPDRPASVTYDLTRLQGLQTPEPICLSLNRSQDVDSTKQLARFSFSHPVFNANALAAQRRWGEINGQRRTWFAGAYWGNGFHEDGVNSALAITEKFNLDLNALSPCKAAFTSDRSPIGV